MTHVIFGRRDWARWRWLWPWPPAVVAAPTARAAAVSILTATATCRAARPRRTTAATVALSLLAPMVPPLLRWRPIAMPRCAP